MKESRISEISEELTKLKMQPNASAPREKLSTSSNRKTMLCDLFFHLMLI